MCANIQFELRLFFFKISNPKKYELLGAQHPLFQQRD